MVDAELTRLIEKRAATGDGDPEACDELWKASVRRYRAREREENRAAWHAHHETMYRAHARLAAEHAAKAFALLGAGDRGEGRR